MSNLKKIISNLLLAVILFPVFAFGAQSLTSVSGTWSSVTGGQNITGQNTNTVMWGATTTYRSGYKFTAPASSAINLNTLFSLGTFTHMNQIIPLNTAITAATLKTNIKLNIEGTLISETFNFNFLHNETPNIINTCPVGSVSICDDIVTLTNNSLITKEYTINGSNYTLKVLGFQYNNQLMQSFYTKEKLDNSASLMAVLTKSEVVVPEPSTYLMLGSVLAFCAYLKARKGRESKEIN